MGQAGLFVNMVIALAAALLGGMAARWLRLPVILGYLFVGIVIGPYVLGLVPDVEQIQTLAEIGVVLLLFTLGLEFSLRTLREMGRVAIFGGLGQILATAAFGLGVAKMLHWSIQEAILFGLVISLSSTAIVFKTLMDRGELNTAHGRLMVGILLVQDLSVVPMMVVLPAMGQPGVSLLSALGLATLKAVLFLGAMLVLGFWGLPWLMRRVAGVHSRELFLLAVVCMCLGAAFGAYFFGLSVAFGAFIAGLLISESEYAHQALADIIPLRDIFVTLFFVSLGMLADPRFVVSNIGVVAGVVAAIILGKFIISCLVPWFFGYSVKTTLFVGTGLFQIGEFSFVLAAVALAGGLISNYLYSLILASAAITMLLTPFAMSLTSGLYHRLSQGERISRLLAGRPDPALSGTELELSSHVVICGHGRTGTSLSRVLERRNFSYLAIDIDPRVIDSLRSRGIPCMYGDASNPQILGKAGLAKAKVMVVTFPDPIATELAVRNALRINPRLDVVARVHGDEEARVLREMGVAELVRPEFEAGLEIVRHTLHRFGLSVPEIEYIVNTLREEGLT